MICAKAQMGKIHLPFFRQNQSISDTAPQHVVSSSVSTNLRPIFIDLHVALGTQ